jgi:hypothetical protein
VHAQVIAVVLKFSSLLFTFLLSVLLAHAAAVNIFRVKFQKATGGVIGFTADSGWCEPACVIVCSACFQTIRRRSEPWSASSKDVEAAERALVFSFAIFLDPLIFGDWPEEIQQRAGFSPTTVMLFILSSLFISSRYATPGVLIS